MPSRAEAVQAAAALLERVYPDRTDSLVMFPQESVDHPYGWVVRFDFKEHVESGDWLQSPVTSVVIVPHDGSKPHFPPSVFPVEDYMSRRASGDWPPKE
ncbi:YrhB domain-containing protein [Streptomyces sp. NPDC006552]|uniref:YrhB domain-containing protein n=1 Tax=Streptomyces sp. NPDC006552 TaxID=3157179 RepID=UPI0033AB7683